MATEDEHFDCHRTVLAANSDYFASLFDRSTCDKPVIVLSKVSGHHFAQLVR
jgi:hypothetical protein